jgi:hypothetical protein
MTGVAAPDSPFEREQLHLAVCLLPSSHQAAALVALADSFPRAGQVFRVDPDLRRPHITLFMAQFKAQNAADVASRTQELAAEASAPLGTAYGISVTAGRYVEIGYYKTADLARLHDRCVRLVGGLRDRTRRDHGHNRLEDEMALAHGYKLSMDAFRPHATLCVFEGATEIVLGPNSFEEFDDRFPALAVAEMDTWGAMLRLLAVYDLA